MIKCADALFYLTIVWYDFWYRYDHPPLILIQLVVQKYQYDILIRAGFWRLSLVSEIIIRNWFSEILIKITTVCYHIHAKEQINKHSISDYKF
jgi:hypothetical protein